MRRLILSCKAYICRIVRVAAGGRAELPCRATAGFPAPTMIWRRADGRPLPSGRDQQETPGKLVVRGARKEDRGEFVCRAVNELGRSKSRTVVMDVEFAPEVRAQAPFVPQVSRQL